MRARLGALGVLAAVAVTIALAAGGESTHPPRYWIELDNAFGLVEAGDVRVAGVNAGQVRDIKLDQRSLKALVEVEIADTGGGKLRRDAFCQSRPQSPIGEYFVDCIPGDDRRELPAGARLPVRQTASTIPPDLITNIMRRPYRERLRLIVNEFGAGLAGRAEDLNAAIRRAVPALRQTNRVLAILADHDTVIRDLAEDADVVFKALADNRRNVGRFVIEARDTAQASAERSDDLQRNWNRLPGFLEELRPTMVALGQSADAQTPVLADLGANARRLTRLLADTGEFSRVSRPSLRAFGEAAAVGREATRAARPRIAELRRYSGPTVDLANNLAIVLEDFSDPARAVEPDPRSPGGRGFSGVQALLRYVFTQVMSINAFDEVGHLPRVALHTDKCAPYANAETAKRPGMIQDCAAWLGPNQPGVTTPDPTLPASRRAGDRERRATRRRGRGRERGEGTRGEAPSGSRGGSEGGTRPASPLPPALQQALEALLRPGLGAEQRASAAPQLLDFLLAP